MEKILEYINKNLGNKFKDLLLFDAVYSKTNDDINLTFKYPKESKFSSEEINQLKELCSKYFGNLVHNVSVDLKVNTISMIEFKDDVKRIIKSKSELAIVTENDISFDFDNDTTIVSINYPKNALSESVIPQISQELAEQIGQELNANCSVNFNQVEVSNDNILELRKEKIIEDNKIYEAMLDAQVVKISNIQPIVGEIKSDTAIIAGCLGGEFNVTVVGVITDFTQRETKPKQTENVAEEDKEKKQTKTFYTFTLTHNADATRCVWFPLKNAEVPQIELNRAVVVDGTVSEFKGEKSVKVKSFAYCNFEEPKEVWRSAPSEYRFVKPEKYESFEQASLFAVEKKTDKEYLLNNTFVVYDLETTGISFDHCKIIDIGAFKIVDGKIVEKFSTFVKPECPIPEEASAVNHITDQMVANSPTIENVLPDFYKFCEGSTIVGYNNIGFDDIFIRNEAKKLRYNFSNKHDDVFVLARKYVRGARNYKLGTVCEFENVQLIDAHRATNDALATAKLFIKIIEKYT